MQQQSNDRKPVQKNLSLKNQNHSSTFLTNGVFQELQTWFILKGKIYFSKTH